MACKNCGKVILFQKVSFTVALYSNLVAADVEKTRQVEILENSECLQKSAPQLYSTLRWRLMSRRHGR